jgi:ribosomal protein L11 methyltransferase
MSTKEAFVDYIQVAIHTKREAVEALSYFLIEDGAGGVQIDDPQDVVNQDKNEVFFDLIEEDLIKADTEDVRVIAYYPMTCNINEKTIRIAEHLKHIAQFLEVGSGETRLVNMPEEEWANAWKKYYKPVYLGKNILIKPTWETCQIKDELVIEMDPGMAFGTGTHATTAMCAALIEKYTPKGQSVIDIGTGSGILAILAAKLGAKEVVGVDIDAVAIKVATENIQNNHVEHQVKVSTGNLIEVITEKGDLVVSNIIADVIIDLASKVNEVIAKDGLWIASGIIDTREEDVVLAMNKNGFEIVEIVRENDWVAIVSKRGNEDA